MSHQVHTELPPLGGEEQAIISHQEDRSTGRKRPTGFMMSRARALRASSLGKGVLTLGAVAALASGALLATGAAFNDQVTMAQITVTGGSVDVVANTDADDAVAWAGTFDVSNMQPGQVETADVDIDNVGTLPFTIKVSANGADTNGCFALYFRETAVLTGTGAPGPWPVNLTSMGTATTDVGVVLFTTDPTNIDLPDNGADLNWEIDDSKSYQLSMRMKDGCVTNGATGTLDVTIDAVQV